MSSNVQHCKTAAVNTIYRLNLKVQQNVRVNYGQANCTDLISDLEAVDYESYSRLMT